MDCKAAKKLIPVHLDGELSDAQARQLDGHIAACAACRDELASVRGTMEILGAWPGIESRYDYAGFLARAEQAKAQRFRCWRFPVWNPAPRWATVGLVAIAFLGGSASGVYRSAHATAHQHTQTAELRHVSDSLSLDAFGGGLDDALNVTVASTGEVAQ